MQPTFKTTEPSGDVVEDVSATRIVEAMRNGGNDYWRPRSPVLQISAASPRFELMLMRHRRRGWYVLYTSTEPERRHLVAVAPQNFSEKWVEIWAFDKKLVVPEKTFVPLAAAERIVEEYFATKESASDAAWHDFDWDLHMRESLHESWIVEWADPDV